MRCEEPDGTEFEISIFRLNADSDIDVLETLADRAEQNGWVLPSFRDALIERERAYPTGLPTPVPVAIPHADAIHVVKAGLGVALLTRPVPFGEMGGTGSSVSVQVVVMILVQNPADQILLLTQLIALFQRPRWFDRLEQAGDLTRMVAVFAELLEEVPTD
jgi:PTS system galactitol-specific IIA component